MGIGHDRGHLPARQQRRASLGQWEVLDTGDGFVVKRITVKPGAALSPQLHHHCEEHWIIVRGCVRVTRGGDLLNLNRNDTVFIPLRAAYRMGNIGDELAILAGCGKMGWPGPSDRDSIACSWMGTGWRMRGADRRTEGLFSYVSCESRVPAGHPLRAILPVADAALVALSSEFQQLYALNGRPSIPPEKLLRALLLQAFYSVRSERQLMEQLDYNLLFRWFVGLGVDDPVWDVTVLTKNRDRLLAGEIAAKFLRTVLAAQGQGAALGRALAVPSPSALGRRHADPGPSGGLAAGRCAVGSALGRWASMKSFRPKDGTGEPPAPGRNGERDFHGERRTNETHASTTDPEARLYRKGKGKEAKLCFPPGPPARPWSLARSDRALCARWATC